jgi:hypothetical protein
VFDPVLAAIHFTSTVLDYHVFGGEAISKVMFCVAQNFLFHARSIYVSRGGKIERYTLAPLCREPNGVPVLSPCCKFQASFLRRCLRVNNVLIFRCKYPNHPQDKERCFEVNLIPKNGCGYYFIEGLGQRVFVKIL